MLTESAIDALSAHLLLALPPDTLVASTAGVASTLPRWLLAFRGNQLVCGYDVDEAIRLHVPSLSRLRPSGTNAGARWRLDSVLVPLPLLSGRCCRSASTD